MPISDEQLHKIIQGASDQTLDLRPRKAGEEFHDADIVKLVKSLKTQGIDIKRINLADNDVGDEGMKALIELETLEDLDVSNGLDGYDLYRNHITANGAKALASSKLKQLKISCNSIGDEGVIFLAKNKTITVLEAEACDISAKEAAEFFRINNTLRKLNLSANVITDEGVRAVNLNHSLEELDLSNCSITSSGAASIAQCPSLKKLNLGGNKIQGPGGKALAGNVTIESLNVSDCELGDAGIAPFGKNNTLKSLSASGNSITAQGAKILAECYSITDLNLSNNHIDKETLKDLMSMKSLTNLTAAYNKISEEATQIVESTRATTALMAAPVVFCPQSPLVTWYSTLKAQSKPETASPIPTSSTAASAAPSALAPA